jgi:hypothetical protein
MKYLFSCDVTIDIAGLKGEREPNRAKVNAAVYSNRSRPA